jgi:acetyltransferase
VPDFPTPHEIAIAGGEHLYVRTIRPEDEQRLAEMLAQASPQDIRFRCFGAIKDFPHTLAARLTRINPERETTLVAVAEEGDPGAILGVVHIICERLHPDTAEYDIMVRSDHKGHGLGYKLMQEILLEARRRGLKAVEGFILRENHTMLVMAGELGFKRVATQDDMITVRAEIEPASPC